MTIYLLSWLAVIAIIEITSAHNTASVFGQMLVVVCSLSMLLGTFGLDLVALTVIVVYSSVFLFLFFFALYLNSLFSKPQMSTAWHGLSKPAAALVLFVFSAGVQQSSLSPLLTNGDEVQLWVDYTALLGFGSSPITSFMHSAVMVIFVAESIILNILLFIGLIAGLSLLTSVSKRGGSQTSNKLSNRVVAVHGVRRQWRRGYSSSSR